MRTSMVLPKSLLAEAQTVSGAATQVQAVRQALTEMIARYQSRRILSLKGSLQKTFDYKASRRKR